MSHWQNMPRRQNGSHVQNVSHWQNESHWPVSEVFQVTVSHWQNVSHWPVSGVFQVTVSPWQNVSGLERRVVVSMGEIADYERFYVMSRCTAQLIWIDNELHGTGGSFT